MIQGLFIAIEGIDGAGTTTHAERLYVALRERGLPVHLTREPSDGPIGVMLRQILSGRIVVPGIHGPRSPDWATMALLFAADRLDHIEAEVLPNLMDGVTVITDRYDYSSVAYQSVTGGSAEDTIAWVKELNRHARRPDLTLVLDVPPDVASQRRSLRARAREIYEEEEIQTRLAAFYRNIESHFPGDRVVHIDATPSIDTVAAAVMREVRILRNES